MGKLPRIKIPQVPATEIADPKLRGVIDAVRETLRTRGHGKERWITMADLEAAKIVQVNKDGTVTVPTDAVAPPPTTDDADAIPCMPPPPPTGLKADGVFTMVFLSWDQAPYPYSARHAFTEIWRAQEDNLGRAVFVGTTQSNLYADYVAAGGGFWYYWIRHVNECNGIGPYNATVGTMAETMPDIDYLLDLFAGKITEEQLYIDLNKRIDLVDGGPALPGSVDQRIEHTETMFQNETDRLSQEISLLTTGVSGSLDPYQSWYFDDDEEAWAPATWASGWITVSGTDAITLPTNFSPEINGAQYMVVVIRVTRLAGTGWKGRVRYRTAAHDFDDDYFVDILDPGIAAPTPGELNRENAETLYWDMSTLTAPSVDAEDWMKSGILAVELQLGDDVADEFSVDYITIGRFGPGASVASVYEESTARISADQALAVQITNLRGQYETNLATINATLSALATTDQALASSITTLQASFDSEVDRLDARVDTEQTARASADSALASSVTTLSTTVAGHTAAIQQSISSIDGLSGEYAVRLDVGGRVTGFGLYGDATSTKFFVNADQFAIVGPNSGTNTAKVPFFVLTNTQVIGGVTFKPGTYIDTAFIADATITGAKIGIATIERGNIAVGEIVTAHIAQGNITNAKIGNQIYSDNWTSPDGPGWLIDKIGDAWFKNVTVKGRIEGETGYFKGELRAATGTFAGTLTAFTGSFRTLVATPSDTADQFGPAGPGVLRSPFANWTGAVGASATGRGFLLGQRNTANASTAYFFVGSKQTGGKSIEYDEGTGNLKMNGKIVQTENLEVAAASQFVGDVTTAQNYNRLPLISAGFIVGDASYGIVLNVGSKVYPTMPTSGVTYGGRTGVLAVSARISEGPGDKPCVVCTASAMARAFGDNGNIVVGMDWYNNLTGQWFTFAASGGSCNTEGDVNVSVTGRILPEYLPDNLVRVSMWVQANSHNGSNPTMRGDNFSLTVSSSKK